MYEQQLHFTDEPVGPEFGGREVTMFEFGRLNPESDLVLRGYLSYRRNEDL